MVLVFPPLRGDDRKKLGTAEGDRVLEVHVSVCLSTMFVSIKTNFEMHTSFSKN